VGGLSVRLRSFALRHRSLLILRGMIIVMAIAITLNIYSFIQFKSSLIHFQVVQAQNPSQTWKVKSGSVYDGDTFRAIAVGNGEEIKIRIACIDAPELKQPGGKESRDYLRRMLPDNQKIILVIANKDNYGRSVAKVYVPKPNSRTPVLINGEMLRSGMAHFYKRYQSACPTHAKMYETAEKVAISSRIGVWSQENLERPWNWRKKNKKNK